MKALLSLRLVFPTICLLGCSDVQTTKGRLENTKLIYFGFDNHSEKQADVLRLAETWGGNKLCPHWRATVSEKDADYKVLFGTAILTIVGRRGEVIYSGGFGPLYLPHGNPDGSGVNICKLTGE